VIPTLAMVLAGGKGRRLAPLTCHRAKPAVPFGGRYRIVDFVLSNLLNSGYNHIYVLTQYMASSLIRHLNRTWHLSGLNHFIEVVPAQMRSGGHWYQGTADSVWQNRNLLRDAHAENIAIFGGDHVYKFDVRQMEEFHRDQAADLTIAVYPVPIEQAPEFGVFELADDGTLQFREKPSDPQPMKDRPGYCLASMGNYFFRTEALENALSEAEADPSTSHDFGKDIIPRMLRGGYTIAVYDFDGNTIAGEPVGSRPYWRDVGTLDAYFDANMDVRDSLPNLNLYNFNWRIRTAQRHYPPARFVSLADGSSGKIVDSLVCEGTICCGATLHDVLCGYDCYIHAGAHVEDSVILSGCDVGAGSHLRGVLFDKNVSVAPGTVIGEDPKEDRERFPFITPAGRVVLPKGTHVPAAGPLELARDVTELLLLDPDTKSQMDEFRDRYVIGLRDRHSHDSVGPRFRRFGPDALD